MLGNKCGIMKFIGKWSVFMGFFFRATDLNKNLDLWKNIKSNMQSKANPIKENVISIFRNCLAILVSFITSCVSGRGNRIGPVPLWVCVCLSVSALTTEPLDLRTWYLVQAWTLTISLMSSMIKVKVQGHESEKISIFSYIAIHWKTSY